MAMTQYKEPSLTKLGTIQPKDFVNYICMPHLGRFNLLSMHPQIGCDDVLCYIYLTFGFTWKPFLAMVLITFDKSDY